MFLLVCSGIYYLSKMEPISGRPGHYVSDYIGKYKTPEDCTHVHVKPGPKTGDVVHFVAYQFKLELTQPCMVLIKADWLNNGTIIKKISGSRALVKIEDDLADMKSGLYDLCFLKKHTVIDYKNRPVKVVQKAPKFRLELD